MKQLTLLSIILLGSTISYAMETAAPTIVLPKAQEALNTENGARSNRNSFDSGSEYETESDWDELSPRKAPEKPTLKTLHECYDYLKNLSYNNKEIYWTLLNRKSLDKVLDGIHGFGCYHDGLATSKYNPLGREEYYLTNSFKSVVKTYLQSDGSLKEFVEPTPAQKIN